MGISVRVSSPIRASKVTLNVKGVSVAILTALNSQAKILRGMLESTTATWEHDKPKWRYDKKGFGYGSYSVGVTAPQGFGAQKWAWLDQGTLGKPRWAMMRRGFQPKTGAIVQKLDISGNINIKGRSGAVTTGVLIARPGVNTKPAFVGENAFLNRRLPAQPGIEPRRWTETIIALRSGKDGPFAFAIQNAINKTLGTTDIDWGGPAKDVGGGYSYDEAGNIISNKTKPITGLSSHTGEVAGSVTFIVDLDDKGSGETSTPATRRRNPLPIKPGGGWANRPPVPYFKRRVGRGNDW